MALRAGNSLKSPRLKRIAAALAGADPGRAEAELRDYLTRHSDDSGAMFLLAQVTAGRGCSSEAVSLFERCLGFDPDFDGARFALAKLLLRLHRYGRALGEADRLVTEEPNNRSIRKLKATILGGIGEEEAAAEIWRGLAEETPKLADSWIRYGDSLRAIGRQAESLAAYRRASACRPSYGLAWWSLANMKTVRLDDADIASMSAGLAGKNADPEDRANLLFALGKAHEDRGDFARAFEFYARGNAMRRLRNEYDWDDIASEVARQKSLFTADFLHGRSGAGCPARDPIFILGRPRSGSTLVEQILSSHSQIEGTAELPYVADCAFELEDLPGGYPAILARLEPADIASLGEEYMAKAHVHRRLGRPRFIDKAPANYHHVGLIALMLPNAKIVDARRNPAACCFSMFTHNYADTNLRLSELGLVWRNYAELMAHFDRVLRGRVHRVIYENMVGDPRTEIARLLEYLELPFEEDCLRFHETKRAVRSPSSEQVRRPISADAVEHWRHFEPWLKPLLDSLGSALPPYPRVPEDLL